MPRWGRHEEEEEEEKVATSGETRGITITTTIITITIITITIVSAIVVIVATVTFIPDGRSLRIPPPTDVTRGGSLCVVRSADETVRGGETEEEVEEHLDQMARTPEKPLGLMLSTIAHSPGVLSQTPSGGSLCLFPSWTHRRREALPLSDLTPKRFVSSAVGAAWNV
ncbi:unnamed protein product [Lampetra fluviatilis]